MGIPPMGESRRMADSIPSFASNVRFFLRYQVGHMMLRYVLWNFSGRQNGALGDGGYDAGNAITGISILDRHTLGLIDYDEPSSGESLSSPFQ